MPKSGTRWYSDYANDAVAEYAQNGYNLKSKNDYRGGSIISLSSGLRHTQSQSALAFVSVMSKVLDR